VTSGPACITGVGLSAVGRSLFRTPLDLAIEAVSRALDDAGLSRQDIDGLAAFNPDQGSVGALQLQDAMGLELSWFAQCDIGPSQLSALFEAGAAVETRRASHVVAFHASVEGSARARMGRGRSLPGSAMGMPERAQGWQQWTLPFGAVSAGHPIAIYAQRHMHLYGTTREQLAQIPLVQRANAALNPNAIYRDPLTMEDYFAARMITDPFCLFDCDIPIDFGTAVVVSAPDAARSTRKAPIRVAATSTAARSRSSWDQFDDLSTMMCRDVGADLWTRTDFRPQDVDVAQLYDGFSFIALAWLEALGLCGRGEGGPFIEGGQRISRDGPLPLNTNGGQLSAGRMHGWGYVGEACSQLWGEGGDRQVPSSPRLAVVGSGGGIFAGALLLACDAI
jgi:acetyl-CoA acetyltransferase